LLAMQLITHTRNSKAGFNPRVHLQESVDPDTSSPTYAKDFEYSKTAKSVEYSIKNFVLGLKGEEDSLGKVPDLQKTRDFLHSTLTGADMNKG